MRIACLSPARWLQRRAELKKSEPRRKALEAELTSVLGIGCTLVPARSKGGYDQIYYAVSGSARRAVVRVNNPHKVKRDPVDPRLPLLALAPAARLEREWDAYVRLFPLGLSPQPLWRTEDAIACSWVDWGRASEALIQRRSRIWPLAAVLFPAVRRMHDAGVVHLDLNLGNLLFAPDGSAVAMIDFEYGPAAWVSPEQQQAFDYLRLIDDLLRTRRGGQLALAEPDRLVAMVRDSVPAQVGAAPMGFSHAKLQNLAVQADFCARLLTVFPNLHA